MSCPCSNPSGATEHLIGRQYQYGAHYQPYPNPNQILSGGPHIGMIAAAAFLVIICGLLTGLTLAVCGLDMNYLQLRSVTGSLLERRQAQKVLRMKRHTSWLLCSLILCSVACSQTFPFVLMSVWDTEDSWLFILISTLIMTIFVEIIPQYWIPQQAISWGYWCRPLIWFCMWITCIITYPLGWLLDTLYTKKDRVGIFTNEELQAVIHYHERSAKRGGKIGQDAARIMRGALKLDSQKLGGDRKIPPQPVIGEQDVEKANSVVDRGIIVKWDAVKTININDTVDEDFVKKVQSWSYSRIPVIGKPEATNEDGGTSEAEGWEGSMVFGFLHVKNLIGINTTTPANDENKLKVKDLVLYPLPIVRADMSIYELLNLFQLGISRMAVVVRESSVAGIGKTGLTKWTATERTSTHLMSNLKAEKGQSHWTQKYLQSAEAGTVDEEHPRRNVLGIECPKPIGIIAFEDVIDTILQKTSRDERDFFDRNCSIPPTKIKKAGDHTPNLSTPKVDRNLLVSPKRAHVTFDKSAHPGTLRQRKVSNKVNGPGGLDGADDRSFDGYCPSSIRLPKKGRKSTGSSYTDNIAGGFHGANESGNAMDHAILMTPEEIVELANTSSSDCPGNPYSHVKTASLPTLRSDCATSDESRGHRIVSAGPKFPQLRRVAPFSRDNLSSFEKGHEEEEGDEMTELSMPVPSTIPGPFPSVNLQLSYNPNISGIDIEELEDTMEPTELQSHVREHTGETVSIISWSSDGDAQQLTRVYDALPVPAGENQEMSLVQQHLDEATKEQDQTKPYDGFPPELLENALKENRVPDYLSKTLPRTIRSDFNLDELAEKTNDTTPPTREASFHDDRALLPSQRRLLENSNGSLGLGTRSSSLWF